MSITGRFRPLIRNKAVFLTDVTSWQNLVQWQPPDGSRLVSGFLVGTDAIILFLITRAGTKIRCYYKLLRYASFLVTL